MLSRIVQRILCHAGKLGGVDLIRNVFASEENSVFGSKERMSTKRARGPAIHLSGGTGGQIIPVNVDLFRQPLIRFWFIYRVLNFEGFDFCPSLK